MKEVLYAKQSFIAWYLNKNEDIRHKVVIEFELRKTQCRFWDKEKVVLFPGIELSIMGEMGDFSFGQIYDTLLELERGKEIELMIRKDLFVSLIGVWKKWHLNALQAGCPHQQKHEWGGIRWLPMGHRDVEIPIDSRVEVMSDASLKLRYGKSDEKKKVTNLIMWNYEPYGVLLAKCPICGYPYGKQWLCHPLPPGVIDFVINFPGQIKINEFQRSIGKLKELNKKAVDKFEEIYSMEVRSL